MKVFTYNQYIKCIHTFRLNAVMQLAEESAEYNLEQAEKKYSHDKLIKNILQDKKEATKFINEFVEPREKVKEKELIRYTNNYITKKYKSKEADLIYKLKDKEMFFLIEHQSAIDNNMSYRVLNYCLDIMREYNMNKKMGKNMSYPIIVPIVIYTGNQKWKMPKKGKEKQISNYVFERYQIDLEYNFIDINKIPKQILLEKNTMFGYSMFLEKSESYEELIENLDIMIETIKNKEKLKELANIISYLLNDVLEEKVQKQLLQKIERKVGERGMSILIETLRKESMEKQINQGKQESQRKIAKNMIYLKVDEDIILKTTEINKEQLEEIKKELVTAS